tara:strand:- start:240 stop:1550 length:1311 start_codon:yes stop_codon:yes gene_type:complete
MPAELVNHTILYFLEEFVSQQLGKLKEGKKVKDRYKVTELFEAYKAFYARRAGVRDATTLEGICTIGWFEKPKANRFMSIFAGHGLAYDPRTARSTVFVFTFEKMDAFIEEQYAAPTFHKPILNDFAELVFRTETVTPDDLKPLPFAAKSVLKQALNVSSRPFLVKPTPRLEAVMCLRLSIEHDHFYSLFDKYYPAEHIEEAREANTTRFEVHGHKVLVDQKESVVRPDTFVHVEIFADEDGALVENSMHYTQMRGSELPLPILRRIQIFLEAGKYVTIEQRKKQILRATPALQMPTLSFNQAIDIFFQLSKTPRFNESGFEAHLRNAIATHNKSLYLSDRQFIALVTHFFQSTFEQAQAKGIVSMEDLQEAVGFDLGRYGGGPEAQEFASFIRIKSLENDITLKWRSASKRPLEDEEGGRSVAAREEGDVVMEDV